MTGVPMVAGISGGQIGGGTGLTVFANPSIARSIGQTSPEVTASPNGGTSPYTYQWVTGDQTIRPDMPAAASTTFTTSSNQKVGTTVYCNVSDADGLNAQSNNVFVSLNSSGGDGGGGE